MEYQQFILITRREADLGTEEAECAARAALTTLAERLPAGGTRDLLDELPAELRPWVDSGTGAERFDAAEYLRRVARREGVDVTVAERHARAVFAALEQAVGAERIAGVAAELTPDFEPLIVAARRRTEPMPAAEFWAQVADRTGLDDDGARRAADVVLEALGERIAGSQVDALILRLPRGLHDPIRRGRARSGGMAREMSLDAFLGLIAERASVDPFEGSEHARAVLATLREAIGDREFATATAGLPPDHQVLLPGP